MKRTAVEWFNEEINKLKVGTDARVFIAKLFKKAKEMEKEQMRSASCPYIGGWEDGEFDYWYNEKYKK
jgi:hypothetical protein